MATTLNVCSRLYSKVDRFQVAVSGLEDIVKTLAAEISKHLNSKVTDFDIIYSGQVLKPNKSLSSYCLQQQSTVYVVHKFVSQDDDESYKHVDYASGANSTSKNDVIMAIQSALLVDDYRRIVEGMLNDPETVENVIATTPGLDKDPSVLAMLQDPELLAVLAHPNNIESLLQLHPSFAQAAITIASAVNEEGAKISQKQGNVTYSMDQMSDDDDEMPQASRSRGNISGQSITATQLAAALQAATASGRMSSSRSSPMPSTSQGAASASASGTITSDFFQQAMVHAQSASSDAALQQLREMGITDENVARQALAATNGDIQAAIDLIFGDGYINI